MLLFRVTLPAQSLGGTITGVVTDAGYQPIANASVQLVQVETNRKRNAVTDQQGGFTFASLPPGAYRIEADREGYRKNVQQLMLPLNHEMQIEMPRSETDQQGGFTFASLPPGAYRIEADREGYRKNVQQLMLPLNHEMQIEMPLVPGQP